MLSMNLVTLPDGRIVNLDHLTHVERAGDYVVLHFTGGGEGGSIIRVKHGEGARRVWAYIAGKCTVKIETPPQA
jgi:hypothetical protein